MAQVNKPSWTKVLPGPHRVVQPHEQVENGDYLQIHESYALIEDADKIAYEPIGGAFGTFWREIER